MAYCRSCGAEVTETQDFCLNCGAAINKNEHQYQSPTPSPNDTGGFGWGLLGFCIPIAGLILYLIWKDTQPKNAKAVGFGALISLIVYVAFIIIYVIIAVIIIIIASNDPYYYSVLENLIRTLI
jgi:hypothetical protein